MEKINTVELFTALLLFHHHAGKGEGTNQKILHSTMWITAERHYWKKRIILHLSTIPPKIRMIVQIYHPKYIIPPVPITCLLKPKVLTSPIRISRKDMFSYYSFWISTTLPSMLSTNF
jgi:hypothetical protein